MRIRSYVVLLVLLLLTGCGRSSIMQDIGQEGSNMTWQDYYDLGIRYLSEGNYQEAIIAFTAAIEIDPKQPQAYVGRGDAYIGLGETEENLAAALADYTKALSLGGTDISVYLKIADIYTAQNDHKKSQEILDEATGLLGESDEIEERRISIGLQDSFVQSYGFVEFDELPTEYQVYFRQILNGFLSDDIDSVYSALLDEESFNAIIKEFGGDEWHTADRVRTIVDEYKIQLNDLWNTVQVRPQNGTAYAAEATDGGLSKRSHSSGECANWNWNGSYQWEETTISNTDSSYWEHHVTGTMKNCLVDGIQYTYAVLPCHEVDGSITASEEEYECVYEEGKELKITYTAGSHAGIVYEFDSDELLLTGMFGPKGYGDYALYQDYELWN